MSNADRSPQANSAALLTNHVLHAFAGSLELNLRILRDFFQVQSFEVLPADGSPLCIRDDSGAPLSVHLPSDNVIGRLALLNKCWDIAKPRFVQQVLRDAAPGVVLVDVGANVGLFARQSLACVPAIGSLYAYEPHPGNFSLLERNLRGISRAKLHNVGLGRATSVLEFFIDPDNSGNYSLHVQAMPAQFDRVSVQIRRAADEEAKWLQHDAPIFYKSDTQGHDETIATSLSPEFWSRVRGAIFELWRIPGKEFDAQQFARILDGFDNKVFEKNPGHKITTAAVMKYLDAADHEFDDLLAWNS